MVEALRDNTFDPGVEVPGEPCAGGLAVGGHGDDGERRGGVIEQLQE
ncbi:hypothetical protein GCM10010464_27080 [Pseudonocardia yunnanensis]